jgi:hypothetical protein
MSSPTATTIVSRVPNSRVRNTMRKAVHSHPVSTPEMTRPDVQPSPPETNRSTQLRRVPRSRPPMIVTATAAGTANRTHSATVNASLIEQRPCARIQPPSRALVVSSSQSGA